MPGIRTHPPLSLLLILQSAPPQETFRVFKDDCEVLGMPWYSSSAQQFCVALLVRNPLLQKYPPRKTNIRAFLRMYLSQLQLPETMSLMTNTLDDDVIDSRLMEAYIEYSVNSDSDFQVVKCYKTFYCPSDYKIYLPVRLASGQFTNVGLALWPAAFVLTQLLVEEFTSPNPTLLPFRGKIRLLELGAGVGLTPLLVHRYRHARERLQRCILTDYQPELIENILFNLKSNGIAAGLYGSPKRDDLVYITDILDWTETEENHRKLQEWGCNLIVAADCIYEVELITPLVATLHDALNASDDAIAIVVQTHRQGSTMRRFFDAVRAASLRVESFRVLPTSLDENNSTENQKLVLQPVTVDAGGNLIATDSEGGGDRRHSSKNNNNHNNHNNHSNGDANDIGNNVNSANSHQVSGDNNGSWNGWMGPFYVISEAAVGIHVLRR